jgi:pyridoxamine 5'-phosphate oxidase
VTRAMAAADPIAEFIRAAERAAAREIDTVPAALATVGADGQPSLRIVLVRHVDARGFVFYTNYNSRKGRELAANPRVALCFHWTAADEQVRVEGKAERLSGDESDAYFAGRPRGSQVGAWASEQSAEMTDREELESRFLEIEQRFQAVPVPRPPFWGGFRVVPNRVEFWQGRPDRLHDRFVYTLTADGWRIGRLFP